VIHRESRAGVSHQTVDCFGLQPMAALRLRGENGIAQQRSFPMRAGSHRLFNPVRPVAALAPAQAAADRILSGSPRLPRLPERFPATT